MPTTFHDASKPWAKIKHGLLSGYLSLFLGKLGSTSQQVFFVDGFAGSGRLGDGSEGSPLHAARLAASPPTAAGRGRLKCINVEKSVFAELEAALAPFESSGLITNLRGDFESHLGDILARTSGFPALFFIDPFGTEGAESATIERIAARTGKTEVLIRYDDTRVKRLAMWAHSNRDSLDQAQRKTAEAFQRRLWNLTDEQAAEEVIKMLEDGDRAGSRGALIQGYLDLITSTTSFRYSLCFPIRNPATRGHKYYFAHFSQHPDGYVYMADHMAQAQRAYDRLAADILHQKGDQEPMFPTIAAEADQAVIEANVANLVRALPPILSETVQVGVRLQNRDLYRHIVDRFKWTYLRKEYCAALRKLRDERVVAFDSSDDSAHLTRKK